MVMAKVALLGESVIGSGKTEEDVSRGAEVRQESQRNDVISKEFPKYFK